MYTPCDICSSPLAPVIWGHPMGLPDSLFELAKTGQVIIGGSCMRIEEMTSFCNNCNEYYDKQAEIPDNLH
jgi:hypothetical protein